MDFRRDVRPPEPAEEQLYWSVQIPMDHQMTFGELRDALNHMAAPPNGTPDDAFVQVSGNQVFAHRRRPL